MEARMTLVYTPMQKKPFQTTQCEVPESLNYI